MQAFAKGGWSFPSLPVPFPSLFPVQSLPFPLKVGPLKTARESGKRCKLPDRAGSGAEPHPKMSLVHSKAVRKPLVAIILNILSTMFYVFQEINWRWCRGRHHTVPLAHIRSTPSKSANVHSLIFEQNYVMWSAVV